MFPVKQIEIWDIQERLNIKAISPQTHSHTHNDNESVCFHRRHQFTRLCMNTKLRNLLLAQFAVIDQRNFAVFKKLAITNYVQFHQI